MADRLDLLLGILLDKASQRDLESGLSSIEDHLENLNDAELTDLSNRLYIVGQAAESMEERFASARAEAGRLTQTAEQVGRVGAILSAAGAAIVGGIALNAQQYVSFVEKAGIQGDETADRWVAATKRVQNAQLNLGETSAQVLLPIYEQAAELAEKAAAFVRENPDLVQAALNTGLVVATLGAVGIAVSKGIKLYADFKYLAATAEYSLATARFQIAVREFLAGSALPLGGGGGGAAAGAAGGALATAGRVVGVATLAVGSLVLATAATNAILDAIDQPRLQEMLSAQLNFVTNLSKVFSGEKSLGDLAAESIRLAEASRDARSSVGDLTNQVRDFQQEATNARATVAFIQYRQQEQRAEEQYMSQRAQIVEQSAARIAQIEANYAQQRTRLVEQFAASSAQAVSNFQFQQQQAAEQFAYSEAQALQSYNESRLEQREEYQRQEERSREDHLREMRRLEEDHEANLRDLAIARDALGIVNENRDYERRRREAEEEYRIDRQRRQQDFQRRQRDQEEEFRADRERRRQEFQFRQQQAAEQFAYQQEQAKAQFEERLQQMEEEFRSELALERRQTSERLRDLQLQFREEQIIRRNAFYDIIRDLDANLLNERDLRMQYYAQMQQDLLSFLEATATEAGSNLPGYPTTETHQAGGYGPGYVGAGEFVASRRTTRMLESLVGGRLTQRSLTQVAGRGGGITLNDQRRFYGSISNEERRMIQEDTQDLLEQIYGIS